MGWDNYFYCKECLNYISIRKHIKWAYPERVVSFINTHHAVCGAKEFGIICELTECCDPPLIEKSKPGEICLCKLKKDLTTMFTPPDTDKVYDKITEDFRKLIGENNG